LPPKGPIIIHLLLPLALDSQGLRNYLKNHKTLGASRLIEGRTFVPTKIIIITIIITRFLFNTLVCALFHKFFENVDKSTTATQLFQLTTQHLQLATRLFQLATWHSTIRNPRKYNTYPMLKFNLSHVSNNRGNIYTLQLTHICIIRYVKSHVNTSLVSK